ncbi:MAG: hypothetical protein ACLR60_05700 [Clostridium paraputrificum]
MSKLIKLLNKNIIIITLVGSFAIRKTQMEVFEEVEHDLLLNRFSIENIIYTNYISKK